MSIIFVDSLSNIWPEDLSGQNNYACLSEVSGKYGVYIFRNPSNGNVLYVGEAREQDLKTRVRQNFTENDTGGTFRKNYMEEENVKFSKFVDFAKGIQIIFFTLDKSMLVRALESILIFTLRPKYNKDS